MKCDWTPAPFSIAKHLPEGWIASQRNTAMGVQYRLANPAGSVRYSGHDSDRILEIVEKEAAK